MAECVHAGVIDLVVALLSRECCLITLTTSDRGTKQGTGGCSGTQVSAVGNDASCHRAQGPTHHRGTRSGLGRSLSGAASAAGLQGLGSAIGIIGLKLLQ